jgi:hypothetical protein
MVDGEWLMDNSPSPQVAPAVFALIGHYPFPIIHYALFISRIGPGLVAFFGRRAQPRWKMVNG